MDFLNTSKISQDFLSKYPPEQYQKLIPKIFELGILFLKYNYSKLYFSFEEINKIIYNLYLSTTIISPSISPSPTIPQTTKLKNNKLKKLKKTRNIILQTKSHPNLKKSSNYNPKKITEQNHSVNYTKPFFDINYHVPPYRSLRNNQLYHTNIDSPNFNTQNKKIYPHWWWNLYSENNDYDSEASEEDHHPRNPKRIYPKELEQNIKKIYQKQYISNNRYNNNIRPKYHFLQNVPKINYNCVSFNNLNGKKFYKFSNNDSHDLKKMSYKISYDKNFNIENLEEHQNIKYPKFGNLNAKKQSYKIKKINHLINYPVIKRTQNQ